MGKIYTTDEIKSKLLPILMLFLLKRLSFSVLMQRETQHGQVILI